MAYFNKLTGVLQYGGRPDDFRPNLKVIITVPLSLRQDCTAYLVLFCTQDEAFEESIVDFFETADTNKDGVLDYNDFYAVSIIACLSNVILLSEALK